MQAFHRFVTCVISLTVQKGVLTHSYPDVITTDTLIANVAFFIMNETQLTEMNSTVSKYSNDMLILSDTIASVGTIANLTVAVAFLNHRKLRKKIPNIFIINQVSYASV